MSESRPQPVETFSASWLELREPVDHRSRAHGILPPLQEAWHRQGWRRVLDLGSGTGSNLRYLAPRLGGKQEWTLLDHDARLLQRARRRVVTMEWPGAGLARQPGSIPPCQLTHLRTVVGDLAREGLAEVAQTHLVTASALLDLVSEGWLRNLVAACRDAGAAALFALSYNGSVEWEPAEPMDREVLLGVNRHQAGDKGLGAALGPRAARTAQELFRKAGYATWLEPAPWILPSADRSLVQELTAGWVRAAGEAVPERAEAYAGWGERRLQSMEGESFALTVGHWDLLALPLMPPVSPVSPVPPEGDAEPHPSEEAT
ncbi:MAG: class I SAM-dependent methyltransferase [Gemmatimonadota bacterium]